MHTVCDVTGQTIEAESLLERTVLLSLMRQAVEIMGEWRCRDAASNQYTMRLTLSRDEDGDFVGVASDGTAQATLMGQPVAFDASTLLSHTYCEHITLRAQYCDGVVSILWSDTNGNNGIVGRGHKIIRTIPM